MCKYCENNVELTSSNFCGSAKMTVAGNYLDVRGDKEVIKWFKRIYQPSFRINYCPMCGKRVGDD